MQRRSTADETGRLTRQLWWEFIATRATWARDELIRLHLYIPEHHTRQLARSCPGHRDQLYADGLLGLWWAVERYDYRRDTVPFTVIAHSRVRELMVSGLRKRFAYRRRNRPVSLSKAVGDDGTCVGDLIADTRESDPADVAAYREIERFMAAA